MAPVYDMRSSNFIDNIRVNIVVIVINHVSSNHSDSISLGSKLKRSSPTKLHIVNINISS